MRKVLIQNLKKSELNYQSTSHGKHPQFLKQLFQNRANATNDGETRLDREQYSNLDGLV